MIKDWNIGIRSGFISLVVSLVFTYLASLLFPTTNLTWAMIAVAIASFLSGFFSSQYK